MFFDLKDKNYKKAKMKGGLGWIKNIGNDPRSLFNGNHFSSVIGLVSVYTVFHRSIAAATNYFVLQVPEVTIRGRRLFEGGVNKSILSYFYYFI